MLSECFSGHKQQFNLFLNFPKEVTCYIRNPKQCFSSPRKIYSSANKTKIPPNFFPMNWLVIYFCQCSELWVSLLLEDQRQRAHFETIWFLEVYMFEEKQFLLLVAIYFPLYLFSNQLGFLLKTELSFSFPFIEGNIYFNSGRLPFGGSWSSRSKVAACVIGAVVYILALGQEPEAWTLACFWIEEPLTFRVLIQALLKSIISAHTAFPVKNPPPAPAPALGATSLWNESTCHCSGMEEEFSSMALFTWEREKQ